MEIAKEEDNIQNFGRFTLTLRRLQLFFGIVPTRGSHSATAVILMKVTQK